MSNIHIWAQTNASVQREGNQVAFVNLSSQNGEVTFIARPDAPAALGTSQAVQVWLEGDEEAVLKDLRRAIDKRLLDLQSPNTSAA